MLCTNTGQFFSDWLGWLCNGRDNAGRQRRFEATLEVICRELDAAGVSVAAGLQVVAWLEVVLHGTAIGLRNYLLQVERSGGKFCCRELATAWHQGAALCSSLQQVTSPLTDEPL